MLEPEGCLIHTGLAMELPKGTYGRLAKRSSYIVAGVSIGPGVIHRDFRGEIMNDSQRPWAIKPGNRVAQLVIEKVHEGSMRMVDQLSESRHGSKAFGSTGVGLPEMSLSLASAKDLRDVGVDTDDLFGISGEALDRELG